MVEGGTGKKRHAAVRDGLRCGEDPVLLLATGAYLGEGFDLPALDTFFLAFPVPGRSRVVQFVGRVTRALPDKTIVEVHDYDDTFDPLLRRMHQRRVGTYKLNLRASGSSRPRRRDPPRRVSRAPASAKARSPPVDYNSGR